MAKDREESSKSSKSTGFPQNTLPHCAMCNKPVDSAERKGEKVYVSCHGSREGRRAGSTTYFGG
jgi:hypothetical protein